MAPEVRLFYDDAMLEHDAGPGHPERRQRLEAVRRVLSETPVPGTRWLTAAPAPRAALERVHAPGYVDRIDALDGRGAFLDLDTAISPGSVRAAYLAAGAAIDAVRAAARGTPAFALVRPPGHHAETDRAMGFCLFNNVAVAAALAREELGFRRVLIVDWDVHHGNGTQHAFYDRRDIAFFSTHRYPFYPGTGDASEIGTGQGAGYTVNVPLPAGLGDAEHRAVFDELLVPAAAFFEPDLVLVSAGFDAHHDDPLGGMTVTTEGFAALCVTVRDLADRHAGGRLALVLEGGYNLGALAGGVRACVEVLAGGRGPGRDAAGSGAAAAVIDRVRRVHAATWGG